ncbi:hypothetical protein [Frankia sp. CiP3]|nr:hypothetical protein [Frankia sp. CiP3]
MREAVGRAFALAARTEPWRTLPVVAELAEVSQALAHDAPR